MRKSIGLSSLSLLVLVLPLVASAADLFSVLIWVNKFLNGIIGIIITIAIVVFFWGLVKYLLTIGGEGKHDGLLIMMYGLVTIFVMVSIWGIVRLLQNTFQISGQNQAIIPQGIMIDPR